MPIFHEERVLPVHLIKEEKELGNSSRSHKRASILHLIHELDHINGSKDLIMRLKKKKESAYSEALLAGLLPPQDKTVRQLPDLWTYDFPLKEYYNYSVL